MLEYIRQLIASNNTIILFVYGQAFFVLGLALALQSWQYSRLPFARSLHWLTAFAFTHGLHEWGDVFIPIQAQYLPAPFVHLLLTIQTIVLAVSFTFLFQYGVESLRPLPGRWRYLRYVPVGVLIAWLLWVFTLALNATGDLYAWHRLNNVLARYSLGFPGALLAAYSLHRQAKTATEPFKLTNIAPMLRLASWALLGYSFMGGLIVPAASFFPANVLNQARVQALTLLPVQVYRGFLGLVLAYAIIRALKVFRVELSRRIASMEETQILLAERERIRRELHDSTLQTVYASGLLMRAVERNLARANYDQALSYVRQVLAQLDQAVTDIREHIGQLHLRSTWQSLADGLKDLVASSPLSSLVETNLQLDLPPDLVLSAMQVGHLLAIVNEAMSNVARHAQATVVTISVGITAGRLSLQVEDNGVGLPADLVHGYGLNNMRDRARLLGGSIRLQSHSGRGTVVHVEIPIGANDETLASVVGG